jgi:DNA modification methylase
MAKTIGDLTPNPENPRTISDTKLSLLEKSMKAHGDLSGIVFNRRTGNLVGGHQRTKKLDKNAVITITKQYKEPTLKGTVCTGYVLLDGERFSYREVDWDKNQERAANIAANKQAGQWDLPKLGEWMRDLGSFDIDFDLDLTMFDDDERKQFNLNTENPDEQAVTKEDIDEGREELPEEPAKLLGEVQLFKGDCLESMKLIPSNTLDAVVTDPPYGWRFMGKSWDGEDIDRMATSVGRKDKSRPDGKFNTEASYKAQSAGTYDVSVSGNFAFQNFSEEWAKEALRILKPGGHALIFCGPRTYHRMACGVEDAGFEIRDQLQWLFGSGFPKSLDISKAIDKASGNKRKVIGSKGTSPDIRGGSYNGKVTSSGPRLDNPIIEPASLEAEAWEGWGTALKPAQEGILLARKPLSEKTVAQNVLKWGTGGLNIDACRIGATETWEVKGQKVVAGLDGNFLRGNAAIPRTRNSGGRFPSNLLLDETAAEMLDEQTAGKLHSAGFKKAAGKDYNGDKSIFGIGLKDSARIGDSGGASRFFYVAKSSKSERNLHVDGFYCAKLDVKGWKDVNMGAGPLLLVAILESMENLSIDESGEVITVECPRAYLSTIRTTLKQITELKTWNWLIQLPTKEYTAAANSKKVSGINLVAYVEKLKELTNRIGISPKNSGLLTVDVENVILKKLLSISEKGAWEVTKSGHPTVKPVSLMRYLCKLITPENGLVLDPFMGSGSTGVAALQCGFKFIGMEREEEYFKICEKRLNYRKNKTSLIKVKTFKS